MEVVRLDEETVLKTAGVKSPRGCESLCFRQEFSIVVELERIQSYNGNANG